MEPLLPHPFCQGCIIATRGYDFRKGQAGACHRRLDARFKRRGPDDIIAAEALTVDAEAARVEVTELFEEVDCRAHWFFRGRLDLQGEAGFSLSRAVHAERRHATIEEILGDLLQFFLYGIETAHDDDDRRPFDAGRAAQDSGHRCLTVRDRQLRAGRFERPQGKVIAPVQPALRIHGLVDVVEPVEFAEMPTHCRAAPGFCCCRACATLLRRFGETLVFLRLVGPSGQPLVPAIDIPHDALTVTIADFGAEKSPHPVSFGESNTVVCNLLFLSNQLCSHSHLPSFNRYRSQTDAQLHGKQ
jgi:hypothetical protein